jgi:hypothetical protein
LTILKKGDTLHIPKCTVHSMWNNTKGKTVVNWKVRPAMFTDNFLETVTGLTNDGMESMNGMHGFLKIAMIVDRYSDEFRLSKIPFVVQKYILTALTPVGYILGYGPIYKKYLD